MRWLLVAGRLPGRSLHVAVLLWHKGGCEKFCPFSFNQAQGRKIGLSIAATRRGLRELEKAGLITVERPTGRSLQVTLEERTLAQEDID